MIKKMINEYSSSQETMCNFEVGRIYRSICPLSKGGIGIRLRSPNKTLISTVVVNISMRLMRAYLGRWVTRNILITMMHKAASKKLATVPDSDVKMPPSVCRLKLRSSMGMGMRIRAPKVIKIIKKVLRGNGSLKIIPMKK